MEQLQQLGRKWNISTAIFPDWVAAQNTCFQKVSKFNIFFNCQCLKQSEYISDFCFRILLEKKCFFCFILGKNIWFWWSLFLLQCYSVTVNFFSVKLGWCLLSLCWLQIDIGLQMSMMVIFSQSSLFFFFFFIRKRRTSHRTCYSLEQAENWRASLFLS